MAKVKTPLTFLLLVAVSLCFCAAPRPKNLGLTDGKLAPCPHSPNCISTQSTDSMHKMQPLAYTGTRQEAMEKLVTVIKSMKRTKIIAQTDTYLYVEFTTALMRYVDDVEFSFDDARKTIDFRSASRIGHSDLGVNKKRMVEVTRHFASGSATEK
jgi:uncharacterized protein (DUF1499 family)